MVYSYFNQQCLLYSPLTPVRKMTLKVFLFYIVIISSIYCKKGKWYMIETKGNIRIKHIQSFDIFHLSIEADLDRVPKFHLEAKPEDVNIETSIERMENNTRDYNDYRNPEDSCNIRLVCKNVNNIKPGSCQFT